MRDKSRKKSKIDAVDLLHARYLKNNPKRRALLAQARSEDSIGRKIYELRKKSSLSQGALAKMVGTTTSVISRLEDADYQGHSMSMLYRIANALNAEIRVAFVKSKKRAA